MWVKFDQNNAKEEWLKFGTNSGKSAVVGQTVGQKPLGPAALRVFGLRSGLGCSLRFAFGKSLGRLEIYQRVSLSIIRGFTHGEIFPDNH